MGGGNYQARRQAQLFESSVYFNHPSLESASRDLSKQFGFTLITPAEGFVAGGTPLGSPEFVANQLKGVVDRNERMFDQLKKLDPQCANLLLRQSTLPRMCYLLRTCFPGEIAASVTTFDTKVAETFFSISGLQPTEIPPVLLRAPFKAGGLGLRRLHDIIPAAQLASLQLCLPVLTRVFPPLKGYIDEVKGMKLDGAQMDTREALALRAEVADRGLHVVAWMIDMWVVLTVEGCNASLPPHPLLLLLGHYERLHADNQHFASNVTSRKNWTSTSPPICNTSPTPTHP
jgi:hypothetical protein